MRDAAGALGALGPVFPDAELSNAGEAIRVLARRFRTAGLQTAELDARLIVFHVCGLTRETYFLSPREHLSGDQAEKVEEFAARRLRREPVSRILGKKEFWGHEFIISPEVLDPRPDTETLVEAALHILDQENRTNAPLRILDLGTGSGCILLSLLLELPNAWGVGTDISFEAVEVARQNASRLGLTARSAFLCGNWCNMISGPVDVIVANPPYIPSEKVNELSVEVRDNDPTIALDGGLDGLSAYRYILRCSYPVIREGGWIILEAGAAQADEIAELFKDSEWGISAGAARLYRDMAGVNRVVALKRQTGPG
jgi:release factor glutamine methyltransferase